MVRAKRASGEEEIRVRVRENTAADCWIAEDRKAEGDCLRSRNRQAAGLSLQMEDHLNTMGYSDREEARILEVFSRGLLSEFPNPDRRGCPPSKELPVTRCRYRRQRRGLITWAPAAHVTVITLTFKRPIGRVFTGPGSRSRREYCFRFLL